MAFAPAVRRNSKLRMALTGPAGSGKTYTMLQILCLFGTKRAVMDSERGSAAKYCCPAGKPEGPGRWKFDVENLDEKKPQAYILKIREAAQAGYPLLGIDSLSHSWLAALEMIDQLGGWVRGGKTVSPQVAQIIDAILSYPGHVIATMRSKSEHVIEKDEKTGKNTMKKVGMASVAREGTEFEFDVMLDLSTDGLLTVTKSRCGEALPMGTVFRREEIPAMVARLREWLDEGAEVPPEEKVIESIKFAGTAADLAALGPSIAALTTEQKALVVGAYRKKKQQIADSEGLGI